MGKQNPKVTIPADMYASMKQLGSELGLGTAADVVRILWVTYRRDLRSRLTCLPDARLVPSKPSSGSSSASSGTKVSSSVPKEASVGTGSNKFLDALKS